MPGYTFLFKKYMLTAYSMFVYIEAAAAFRAEFNSNCPVQMKVLQTRIDCTTDWCKQFMCFVHII